MIFVILRSLFSYFLLLLVLLFLGVPCLLMLLLPARWRYDNKFYFWFSHIFYVAALKATLLPITIEGKENIPKEPAIIAANHQSALDIPLVGSLLNGYPHIWLATTGLTKTLLAPILHRMAVLVDMTSPQRGLRTLMQAIKIVDGKKRHLVIFPEGGRDIQGNRVCKFFSGFVILAQRIKRPVVPVMIFDAYKVYPPGSFLIHWHPIRVVVGKPFYMQEGEGVEEFRDRVYEWFVQQVKNSEN